MVTLTGLGNRKRKTMKHILINCSAPMCEGNDTSFPCPRACVPGAVTLLGDATCSRDEGAAGGPGGRAAPQEVLPHASRLKEGMGSKALTLTPRI